MADPVNGMITLPNGDKVEFTLDGMATAAQMDRLISLTQRMIRNLKVDSTKLQKELDTTAKKVTAFGKSLEDVDKKSSDFKDNIEKSNDNFEKLNSSLDSNADKIASNNKALESFGAYTDELGKKFLLLGSTGVGSFDNLNSSVGKNSGALNDNASILGKFGTSAWELKNKFDNFGLAQTTSMATLGLAFATLTGYADKLSQGLKMGIGGGVMDFAISAKTAGLSIEGFTAALKSSDGSFVQLSNGATNGSKEFARLIKEVRTANNSIGLLGLNNQEQAEFVAQQLKLAVGQGFKGRQAANVVIQNSQRLAAELDNLANRTGKSVTELAQSAVKVVSDPIISNFIAGSKRSGMMMTASMQEFAAGMRASFGELGEVLAGDALKTAMAGLPIIVSKSGENLARIAPGIAQELERQSRVLARGGKVSETERQRLNEEIVRQAEAQKEMLAAYSYSKGPMKEAAEQFAALADQARRYVGKEGERRRREEMVAKEFNDQLRILQGRLQEFTIPFLKLLNSVNWNALISGVSAFINTVNSIVTPIANLVSWIGDASGAGTLIGVIVGLAATFTLLSSSFLFFKGALQKVIGLFGFLKEGLDKTITAFTSLPALLTRLKEKINEVVNKILGPKDIGKKPADIADQLKDKAKAKTQLTAVDIAAGFGTLFNKPLYVHVVNRPPGGVVGGPGSDTPDRPGKKGRGRPGRVPTTGLPTGAPEIGAPTEPKPGIGTGLPGTPGTAQPKTQLPGPALPTGTGTLGTAQPKPQPQTAGPATKASGDILRAQELRKQNPNLSAAEALRQARGQPTYNVFSKDFWKSAGGKAKQLGSKLGGASTATSMGSLFGGMALDYAATKADEAGHKKTAGVLDVGSSALAGAGWGGMLGSIVPGVGTAIGAGVGAAAGGAYGLYKNITAGNFGGWDSSDSDKITAIPAAKGVDQGQQNQMLIEYKKVNANLESLIDEIVSNNMLTAKGVNISAETSRFARQTAMNSPQ